MAGTARLVWTDMNVGPAEEDGFKVYRSVTPINLAALPAPLVTLPPSTEVYDDLTPSVGDNYYIVSTYRSGSVRFSDQKMITLGGAGAGTSLALVNSYGSGEIGDVWIYDAANTDAINLGDTITSATGLVNANIQSAGAGAPALVDDGGTLGGQFARLGATASPYGDFLKWAIGSTISQPATIGISINSSETGAMVAVTGSSAASRMQISTTGAGDLVSYAGVTLDSTINAPLGRRTVVVEFDGVSTKMYVDGVLLATGDAGAQGTDTITIGSLWDRTYGINGIIHASFFIDRLMVDAAELDRFHQFLAAPTAAAVTG